MRISRALSLAIAVVYVVIASFDGSETAIKGAFFLILPLALIWFSDEIGSFTGTVRGREITAETPGCVVAFGGWVLLLLPFVLLILEYAKD